MSPNQTNGVSGLDTSSDDMEALFQPPFQLTGPTFQLSSWSSASSSNATTTTTPGHVTTPSSHCSTTALASSRRGRHHSSTTSGGTHSKLPSLPFAEESRETEHDNDEDDDDSLSCDWSVESSSSSLCGSDHDDEMADALEIGASMEEESSRCSQPTGQLPTARRRVQFSECILVRCYHKPDLCDFPQLYYSAHELQKIIEEYVVEYRNNNNNNATIANNESAAQQQQQPLVVIPTEVVAIPSPEAVSSTIA